MPDFQRADQLPQWLRAYVDQHHISFLEKGNGTHSLLKKALQYRCESFCGGTGDRISGIVQAFFMAICTDRLFFIEWNQPVPLIKFLQPNLIQWNNIFLPTSSSDGSETILRKQRIRAVDDHNNEFVLDPYRMPKDVDVVEIETNLFLDEAKVSQFQCTKDYMSRFEDGKDAKDYYRSVFWTLFQWTPLVLQSVEQLKKQLKLISNDDNGIPPPSMAPPFYVAIHVRTGVVKKTKDVPQTEVDGEESWARYYECARAFQQGLQKQMMMMCPSDPNNNDNKGHVNDTQKNDGRTTVPIYLAADSSEVKKKFQNWDGEIRTMPDMEIYHLDRTPKNALRNSEQAALDVFRDLKLLMDSTCIVMSRSNGRVSKFSRMAHWLPPQPRCAAFWNDCGPEIVAEQLSHVLKQATITTTTTSSTEKRPHWCD